jgi:Leucine-rich repeat (LRR) protein
MDIKTLHHNLLEAFSVTNLNKISLTLINLYKNKEYSGLQKIADMIENFVAIEIGNNGKGFSKFMMLYHPDRADFYKNEINRLAGEGNFDALLGHSHIFKLERIDEIAGSIESYEDIDYSPVYEWDIDIEGFRIFTVNNPEQDEIKETRRRKKGFNVYDAVKIRNYGDVDIEFPAYYLEDWDEFELSASDISNLEGVQFMIHVKDLDLSDNYISDISLLSGLHSIEELNLANNNITLIDALDNLLNLRSVILANNKINDIETLFALKNLEYADLSGNPIKTEQVKRLKEAGVNVDF